MLQILFFVVVTGLYLTARRIAINAIQKFARAHHITELRTALAMRMTQLGLFALYVILVLLALNIQYAQAAIFLGSVLAILGIALFAQWSILSNLTASLLIFFAFPYRVGDRVQIVDKDEDISGEIEHIGSFHVQIRRDRGDVVHYPNTLILQKAVIREPVAKSLPAISKRFKRASSTHRYGTAPPP